MADSPVTRELRTLPVTGGPAVAGIFPALEEMLTDRGPALLPVPADDPARTRILVDSQRPGEPVDDRVALVVSTSGSTGTPKGAMLSAEALAASAAATDTVLGGPGRWLLALPAHHIAGLQVILRSLRAGYEPVVVDVTHGFDPEALPAAVDACRAGTGAGPGALPTGRTPHSCRASWPRSSTRAPPRRSRPSPRSTPSFSGARRPRRNSSRAPPTPASASSGRTG